MPSLCKQLSPQTLGGSTSKDFTQRFTTFRADICTTHPKTGRGLLGRTPQLTSFTSAWIYSRSHSECSAPKFSTELCLEYVDWQQPTITISLTHTINHQPQHQPFLLSIFVPEIWSYLSTVLDGFVAVQIWVEKFQVWMFWAPGVPVSPSPIPLLLLGRTFKFKCVQL